MKKSLIALAALAASGFAMAQSSVTMFGIVDVGVGHISSSAGNSSTGMFQSGNASSRLGFRGVEDLGGGLKAGFWVEGAISPDTGTGAGGGNTGTGFAFARRSTVQLGGNFGEVRLGRELTAGYAKPSSYDPFGQVGLAAVQGWQVSRASNGISYTTPGNLGGFSAMVHYGFGENTNNTSAGRYFGVMAAYDNGPLSVTAAVEQTKAGKLNNGYTTAGGFANQFMNDQKSWSLGASYDFGVVKPAFMYHSEKGGNQGWDTNLAVPAQTVGLNADKNTRLDSMMFALTAPIGSGKLIASYTRYNAKGDVAAWNSQDASAYAVGYVYDLSKRTSLYGTVAHMSNKSTAKRNLGAAADIGAKGPVAGHNVTGYQVGIKHSF